MSPSFSCAASSIITTAEFDTRQKRATGRGQEEAHRSLDARVDGAKQAQDDDAYDKDGRFLH